MNKTYTIVEDNQKDEEKIIQETQTVENKVRFSISELDEEIKRLEDEKSMIESEISEKIDLRKSVVERLNLEPYKN